MRPTTRSPRPCSDFWGPWPPRDKARLLQGLTLEALRRDRARTLGLCGFRPDPWQAAVLRGNPRRTLLLCSRQAGKSLTAAALALAEALLAAPALVLILSPTLRQSGEVFRDKLLRLYDALGRPVPERGRTALSLELANGSRVVSLPENEAGVRGFSGVALLVIDEAARVDDALYYAVRPMLAVSRGALVALSTPCGKRGWFWEEWGRGDGWARVRVTAPECPRIAPDFLAAEALSMGPRWYAQEYLCSFEDAEGQVFAQDVIDRAASSSIAPLFDSGG